MTVVSFNVRWVVLVSALACFGTLLPCDAADKRLGETTQPRYRRQYALVVGINYDTLGPDAQIEVPRLKTAENDAQAVRDVLVGHYGFQSQDVHLLLGKDATLQGIRAQFGTEFLGDSSKVKSDDAVFIFYAGHGERQQRHSQQDAFVGMLYPSDLHVIDGKGVDPVSCLRIDDVLRMLQDYCAARHQLLVLDSCHSGEVFNFKSSRSAGVNRGFRANLFEAPVLQAIAAAQATQVAADADISGEHSPFTRVFLDAMAHGPTGDNQSLFTASELFAFIPSRIRAMKDVQQDPRGGWLAGEGDFYFFPKDLSGSSTADEETVSGNNRSLVPPDEVSDGKVTGNTSSYWPLLGTTAILTVIATSSCAWWYFRPARRTLAEAIVQNSGQSGSSSTASISKSMPQQTDVGELYLQVQGSPYAYRAPFGAERVTVGRQRRKAGQMADEGNDFVIRIPESDSKTRLLSRRHLEFKRIDDQYFVIDRSTTGTQLNGRPLVRNESAVVVSGDLVSVAEVLTLEILIRPAQPAGNLAGQSRPVAAVSEMELSPWNHSGVVVEATLGDLVTMDEE
ncbi:MAG: caspase family protein [Planctomycetaceae bacterium]|nr:caspase family protein [Planctomycetaceae bacterium]